MDYRTNAKLISTGPKMKDFAWVYYIIPENIWRDLLFRPPGFITKTSSETKSTVEIDPKIIKFLIQDGKKIPLEEVDMKRKQAKLYDIWSRSSLDISLDLIEYVLNSRQEVDSVTESTEKES